MTNLPTLGVAAAVAFGLNVLVSLGQVGSVGLPSCGDDVTTDLVKQIFNENTQYRAAETDMVRERGRNEQTGAYTCAVQITDNEGDAWNIEYEISNDENNPLGFIVEIKN